MEPFSFFLQILEDFVNHLRGIFLNMYILDKGYHLKDRNLSYKTISNLISKDHAFKMSLKEALLHIYGVRSIYNIVNVCKK